MLVFLKLAFIHLSSAAYRYILKISFQYLVCSLQFYTVQSFTFFSPVFNKNAFCCYVNGEQEPNWHRFLCIFLISETKILIFYLKLRFLFMLFCIRIVYTLLHSLMVFVSHFPEFVILCDSYNFSHIDIFTRW